MAETPFSHLFTLRVWAEVDEDGTTRWRGKLRHVPSDTTHYFRDWAPLVPLLLSVLRGQARPSDAGPEDPAAN